MGSVTAGLLILFPTLAAFTAGRWLKRRELRYSAAVLTAAFLATYPMTLVTRRVSALALAFLALGAAWQLARFASARPDLVCTSVKRVARLLLLVCLAVTAIVNGGRWWRERSAVASLPPASNDVPNVLLLVLDTVRGLEMGVLGYGRETTPNIDRWARRGVVFEKAIAPSPWTLPTHASLFTGKWPHEIEADFFKPLGTKDLTISERLAALGYVTGGFAANLAYCSYLFGLDRGFSAYYDYRVVPSAILSATNLGRRLIEGWNWNMWRGSYSEVIGRKSAGDVNEEFLAWQRRIPRDRPWFAFLNYYDAHEPYDPVEPFRSMFPGTSESFRSLYEVRQRPPEELKALQSAYDGSLAYLDSEVGRLLEELERSDALRNTVVIITSDHGEAFGEHGYTGHGASLHTTVLHVPLIIIYPKKIRPNLHVARYVSLRDLPATIEELISAREQQIPGTSLAPLWSADSSHVGSPILSQVRGLPDIPDRYPASKTNMRSLIVENRWHYIQSDTGREELFDLTKDFWERTNLAQRPEHADLLRQLRDSLRTLVRPKH
jgi:arylsulfatase A-like enzyme